MSHCLFCQIVEGAIPAEIVAETQRTVAFRDLGAQAPSHLLVVPREHYDDVGALAAADPGLLADVVVAATQVATQEGLSRGYRLVTNTGDDAGQSVHHVHVHVLGGARLGLFGTAER